MFDDIKFKLSFLIPIKFTTQYRVIDEVDIDGDMFLIVADHREKASWWQWRGRIWSKNTTAIS